jgi:hypothetical protein
MLISRDVVFYEKTMLQRTHEEKKQVSENYSNNDHEVWVELDTHIKEETIDYSGISSS